MANTTKLKTIVEPYVRGWLKEKLGHEFEKGDVVLSLTTGGRHKFDAVSKDRTIVADIKSNAARPDGKVGTGAWKAVFFDLYLLEKVAAKTKLLVLTDKRFFNFFVKKAEGRKVPDIEILHCPLSESLLKEIGSVHEGSRSEIGKK